MNLDIDCNSTTIWTVAEIDELIYDTNRATKQSKSKRDETLQNLNRIFSELREQKTIVITSGKVANVE